MTITKEQLVEKAASFGEIDAELLTRKSTGWLRAYIEVVLNDEWRNTSRRRRELKRPTWNGI